MSWLVHTENLPSHLPWVMHKHHTSDGRLVITKEKIKRHEYFEAFRSNGRLVLNLVLLNEGEDEEEEEEEEINGHDDENGGGMDSFGLEPQVHN
ncbi:hypothetical protein ACJIZ3_008770 [Penstemon smallii]|uniref:FAF domain-containing protein n=1 Tax=Penstemon smallii TaxID=265156 RepID=A0ABD3TAS1_9LAMI